MFESFVGGRAQKGRGTRTTMIAVSVAVHALAILALVVRSAWAIEKLPEPRVDIVVRTPSLAPPPPPAGGNPARAPEHTRPRRHHIRRTIAGATRAPAPDDGGASTDATRSGAGAGGGGAADGLDIGIAGGPGLDIGIGPAPVATRVDDEPAVVAPTVVRGLRISGDEQLQPPDRAIVQMQRSGKDRVVATARLCLTATGHVQSVSMIGDSGFPAWDAAILRGMRAWRYRPYRVQGKAIPVCTSVTFVYAP